MAHPAPGDREDLAALLALAELPGIGSGRLRTLVDALGGAAAAVRAPMAAIAALPGFGRAAATTVRGTAVARGRAILESVERLGARVLIPRQGDFPELLREIPDPPPVLFAWGEIALLRRRTVAIIGSRDHTEYGAVAARLLASGVARRGAVVVSGMARGVDAIAHEAALEAGGGSVGVLGNGFGVVYPAANRALYARMLREGCLLTEFPPGERPHAGAFPRRNRLISGLAMATVVVEAAPPSGALQTADCALEQGRTVLAVPGPITSPTSVGPNRLIQQGAKPALAPADVLEEIGLPTPAPDNERDRVHERRSRAAAPPDDLTSLQRTLWDALVAAPCHVDALVKVGGGDAAGVLTALTELELRGVVAQKPGMVFERAGSTVGGIGTEA